MSARAALALLLAALAQPTWAASQRPVSRVTLDLSATELVVHQQLVVSLHVAHALFAKPRWQAPGFEGFWTERMNGVGSPVHENEAGDKFRTTTFRRALFPSRAGALAIEDSRLFFDDQEGREHSVFVTGRSVHVRDLPARDRPKAFSGVVGELEIRVSIDHGEVELGRSLPLTIDVFGEANVWDAQLPELQALLGPEVEVFSSRPRLVKTTHGGTLRARRILDFELVPSDTGTRVVPPIEIAYYHPESQSFRVARSEPLPFRTVPRGRRSARQPWEERDRIAPPLSASDIALPGLALLAMLAASCYGMARWWRTSLRRLAREPAPRPRVLLERARDASGSPAFPALLHEALKAGIQLRHRLDARPLTTREIAATIDDGEAVELLEALDRMRFTRSGGDPETLLLRVAAYLVR